MANVKIRFLNRSLTNKVMAIGAALVLIVVGFTVYQLQAGGFFAAAETDNGAVGSNAKVVNDVSASGGKAVVFTAPTLPPPPQTGSCALPAYPTPSCTGVPAGTSLTTVNGDVTLSAGQVLDAKRVTGNVDVVGGNVVIKNSEVYGTVNNWSGGTSATFTIQDSTVGAPSGCNGEFGVGARNYTAIRVNVRNHGDGFRISGDNTTIKDSFVKLCSNPGDHSDGVQGNYAGVKNIIDHNTIDQRLDHDTTSPVFWADQSKDVELTNNLLMGGGFTIRLHDGGGSKLVAKGNRVVDGSWDYGPVSSACNIISWSDNVLVTIDANYKVTSTKGTLNCQ